MPDGLAELIQGIGPLGAFCLALIYLLMQGRKNNRYNSNPGNPGLVNGRWQQEMRDSQRESNATLGRIEEGMKESVRLLGLMEDRQQRE